MRTSIIYIGKNHDCMAQDITALIADASTLGELLESARQKSDPINYRPANITISEDGEQFSAKLGGVPVTSPEYLHFIKKHGNEKTFDTEASFFVNLENDCLILVYIGEQQSTQPANTHGTRLEYCDIV